MNPKSAAGPTSTETALGGALIKIERFDGSIETIQVRQFRIREYQEISRAGAEETDLVCRAIDKYPEWLDSISQEAYEQLASEMRRVNAGFFLWAGRRQEDMVRSLPPGLLGQMVEKMAAPSAKPSSTPPRPRATG